ncbi:hypothetical protein AB4Y89_08975 [Terriglobus sp. 2YAB30_2]|uniref:hypothetical protein n=1 Tax=Terriglobus sp. 2YAB30_2 TaxID=3233023 RepID=UPI003F95C614
MIVIGPAFATLLAIIIARTAKVKLTLAIIGVVLLYSVVVLVLFVIVAFVAPSHYQNGEDAITWGLTLEGIVAALLLHGLIRKLRARTPQTQQTAPGPKPPQKQDPPAATENPAERVVIPRELAEWIATSFALPLSRCYAANAAAARALEQGKSQDIAKQSAAAAAKAWMPKPGVSLLAVSDDRLDEDGAWKSIEFGALSQLLATEAALLRAFELGKDMAQATEAARAAAKAWAPVTPPGLPSQVDRAQGASQGVVYGFMKRTVPFPLTTRRSVTYIDKSVWTFTVQRKGIGENNRPLSPIQVQMEGYQIDGQLEDGDTVVFDAPPTASVVNSVRHIHNLSKGVDLLVHPMEESPAYKNFQSNKILVIVLVIILGGGIVVAMVSAFNRQAAPIRKMFPR